MVFALAVSLLAPPSVPREVAEFKVAFAARRSRHADEDGRYDPAISKCLDILIQSAVIRLKARPDASDEEAEGWVKPFSTAVAISGRDEPLPDDPRFMFLRAEVCNGSHFVVACVGADTRTVCFDRAWHKVGLPSEFGWNYPWNPRPVALPNGLILMNCDSLIAEGMDVPIRLVWMRKSGRSFSTVREFERYVLLDPPAFSVFRGVVAVRSLDRPRSFMAVAADGLFGRLTEWNCRSGKPRLICNVPLHRALRAVDKAIVAADRAKHPDFLQRRIRRAWPKDEFGRMVDEWSEKRLSAGIVQIIINREAVFDLRKVHGVYKVVAARRVGT